MRVGIIYLIRCIITGKVYVGSTIQKWNARWRDHRRELRTEVHDNPHLQKAWNKYGGTKFTFSTLERGVPEDELLVREQHWMDKLRSHEAKFGFNCAYPVKQRVPSAHMTKAHKKYWAGLSEQEKAARVAHFSTAELQAKATEGKRQEEHRQLVSAAVKDNWQRPENQARKEQLRARFNGFKTDKVVLGKISAKAKERWQDKDYRERGVKQIGEASLKAAQALRDDPVKYEARLKLLADGRAKAAAALKLKWQDKEFRERRIAQMKLPRKRKRVRLRLEG